MEMNLVKLPLSQRWDCANNPSLVKATGGRLWHLQLWLEQTDRLTRLSDPPPGAYHTPAVNPPPPPVLGILEQEVGRHSSILCYEPRES